MAEGFYSSQGRTLGYRLESAVGTGTGTLYETRHKELTAPGATRILVENKPQGHAHAYSNEELPVPLEKYREGALSFTTDIRRSATADTAPPIADFFESAGCEIYNTGDTVVTGTPSAVSIPLTADEAAVGAANLVELANGQHWPTLAASYTPNTIVPGMGLPSVPAGADAVEMMTTITPFARPVPTGKTLEFCVNTRGTHTNGQDLSVLYNGCACSEIGDLALKFGESPQLSFTFHVGKVADQSDDIANESFYEGAEIPVVNDFFEVGLATANSSGAIANTRVSMDNEEGMSFNWGLSCNPIPSVGNSSIAGLSGTNGYIQVAATPTLTFTGFFDKDWFDRIETIGSYYWHFIQPTSDYDVPAFGLWLPNTHFAAENPLEILWEGSDTIKAKVTMECTCANYGSETLNTQSGAAPWFFAISGEET